MPQEFEKFPKPTHVLHADLEQRFISYMHQATNQSPANCYRHGRNLAKLAFKTFKIYREVQQEEGHSK